MDTCLECGGAILEKDKPVMFSGKCCTCYVPQKIQRPASKARRNIYVNRGDDLVEIRVGNTQFFVGKNQVIDLSITPLRPEIE